MCCGRLNWPGCSRSSACIRRWGEAGSGEWRSRSMLFKPEQKDDTKIGGTRKPSLVSRILKRMVSLTITLVIVGGLGYIGWLAWQQKQASNRGAGARPDLPVSWPGADPRI